jgi:hypothetical protein
MNNPIAINESRYSEKVKHFIELEHFTQMFQDEYNAGEIHGCYIDDNGKVVAIDGQGDLLTNVI